MKILQIFLGVSVLFLLSRCSDGDSLPVEQTVKQELVFPLCTISDALTQDLISEVMERQEQAWNRGDLEAFMDGYWRSDSLTFIGKSGINNGWQTTLDNYKKSYPDTSAMGKLTFTNIKFDFLGPDHASVIGKWELKRTQGDLSGHYSLIWRKNNGKWIILYDHSS